MRNGERTPGVKHPGILRVNFRSVRLGGEVRLTIGAGGNPIRGGAFRNLAFERGRGQLPTGGGPHPADFGQEVVPPVPIEKELPSRRLGTINDGDR